MISLTSPIETPFHRIPAPLKLAALCLFTFSVYLAEGMPPHIGAVAAVAAMYAVPGLQFLAMGAVRLRPLWPFLAVLFVWHIATADPYTGLQIAMKLVAAVGLANLVTMTTRLDDLISVAERSLAPLRRLGVRAKGLGIAIAMVVRFTPVIVQKGSQLAESWRSRSPRRPGWRIIVPLVLLVIDDAADVGESLRARGGIPT